MTNQKLNFPQNRNSKLLSHIQPMSQDGIEIGPLSTPIITKDQSNGHVYYVDYATTAELREKYKNDPNVNIDNICDVDFIWGEKTFTEIVDGRNFDYMIASHVIEHVPDMIGWLSEIGEVLRDGGVLSLAIPDKRFTFDHLREVSTPGMLIEAYLLKKRRPGPREIFDHLALFKQINAIDVWNNEIEETKVKPDRDTLFSALAFAKDSLETDHYHGVHVNVFTPGNFLDLLEIIIVMNLFEYKIVDYYETNKNSNEFFVSLERNPRSGNKDKMLQEQLLSIEWARNRIQNVDDQTNSLPNSNQDQDRCESNLNGLQNLYQQSNNQYIRVDDVQDKVSELQKLTNKLQQQLDEQRMMADELQNRWTALEQTRTWKLLTALYRLRNSRKMD